MNWAQVIPALLGTLIGGTVSLLTTRWSQAHQWKIEHDRQDKDRERAAVLIAREAVAKLIQLGPKPSQEIEIRTHRAMLQGKPEPSEEDWPAQDLNEAWSKERNNFLLELKMVIGDFADDGFRQRLNDMYTILSVVDGDWRHFGVAESVSRYRVCEHLLDCIGRYGRGARLEPLSETLQEALYTAQDQIAWWDSYEEREKLAVKIRDEKPQESQQSDDSRS